MKNTLKKIAPKGVKKIYKKLRLFKYGEMRVATSISDNQIYPDFCLKASQNSKVFNNFRREYVYNRILEHATQEDGSAYINKIRTNNKTLLNEENLTAFKLNDRWGNPRLFEYEGIGAISPSTLRYINALEDLTRLFGDLGSLKLAEIGVGYGGQCRVISSCSNIQNYTLIDLKPVLSLSQTYLDKYALNTTVRYKTMNELEVNTYDLVISNYAFTELPGFIQDIYLKKVILNSKRGYITYNEITPASFKSYNKKQLLEIIPNSRIIEEIPKSGTGNCIIIWGKNN